MTFSWQTRYDAGMQYFAQELYDKALKSFHKAGFCKKQERWQVGLTEYQLARTKLAIIRQKPEVDHQLLQEAENHLDKACKHQYVYQFNINFQRAVIAFFRGDDVEAINYYARAYNFSPNNLVVYWGIASAQLQLAFKSPEEKERQNLLRVALANYQIAEEIYQASDLPIPGKLYELMGTVKQELLVEIKPAPEPVPQFAEPVESATVEVPTVKQQEISLPSSPPHSKPKKPPKPAKPVAPIRKEEPFVPHQSEQVSRVEPGQQPRKSSAPKVTKRARRQPVVQPRPAEVVSEIKLEKPATIVSEQAVQSAPPMDRKTAEKLKKAFAVEVRSAKEVAEANQEEIMFRFQQEKISKKASSADETEEQQMQRIRKEWQDTLPEKIKNFVIDTHLLMIGQDANSRKIIAENALAKCAEKFIAEQKLLPQEILRQQLMRSLLINFDEAAIATLILLIVQRNHAVAIVNDKQRVTTKERLLRMMKSTEENLRELLCDEHQEIFQKHSKYWSELTAEYSNSFFYGLLCRTLEAIPASLTGISLFLMGEYFEINKVVSLISAGLSASTFFFLQRRIMQSRRDDEIEKGILALESKHQMKQLKPVKVIDVDEKKIYPVHTSFDRLQGELPIKNIADGVKGVFQIFLSKTRIEAILPHELKEQLSAELYTAFLQVFTATGLVKAKNKMNDSQIVMTNGKILHDGKFCASAMWKIKLKNRPERLYGVEQGGKVIFSACASKGR